MIEDAGKWSAKPLWPFCGLVLSRGVLGVWSLDVWHNKLSLSEPLFLVFWILVTQVWSCAGR
jgi:hypothetical protein